jgi:DNA invertase Pin-like site-specific DNA recombinase
MRAAVYARVSTTGNGQSPEMQLREFQEYCERRGWPVAGEYVDVGISGSPERSDIRRIGFSPRRRRLDRLIRR